VTGAQNGRVCKVLGVGPGKWTGVVVVNAYSGSKQDRFGGIRPRGGRHITSHFQVGRGA